LTANARIYQPAPPGQGQGHPWPVFTVRQGVARNCNNQSHAVLQA